MKRLPLLALTALFVLWFSAGCNVNDGAKSDTATEENAAGAQTAADSAGSCCDPFSSSLGAHTAASEAKTELPTMLELGSEGCKPCEQMKPVMAGLERDYAGIIRVTFHDVRKTPDIASQYGIKLIPTQVFLDADGNEFFRHEGFFPREDIEQVFRDMGVEL